MNLTREKLIIANWKRYGQWKDVQDLLAWLAKTDTYDDNSRSQNKDDDNGDYGKHEQCMTNVVFCVSDEWWPYLLLKQPAHVKNLSSKVFKLNGSHITCNLGWQDLSSCFHSTMSFFDYPKYVIVGHQDRRRYDSYDDIAEKTIRAINLNVTPVICVSDVQDSRMIITQTVAQSYQRPENTKIPLIVALEPVISIGSDQLLPWSHLRQQIEAIDEVVHHLGIKNRVFLYGGSVNERNIKDVWQNLSVQGVMVGRSSLPLSSFFSMVKKCTLEFASCI